MTEAAAAEGASATEATAEGAGVVETEAAWSANRRSNHAFYSAKILWSSFCSAESLRSSSSKSLVEGFMVDYQNRWLWYQMLATTLYWFTGNSIESNRIQNLKRKEGQSSASNREWRIGLEEEYSRPRERPEKEDE